MPPKSNVQPLFVHGRPLISDHQVLTPRTPHSRAGRAEEAFTEVELDEMRHDDSYASYAQQQTEPLLASSADSTFPPGYRSRGDEYTTPPRKAHFFGFLRDPLLMAGSALAAIVFFLFVVSVKRPDVLESVISMPTPTALQEDIAAEPTPTYVDTLPPNGRIVSYANYSAFPLTGTQYLKECEKVMGGFMHHATFWDVPAMGPLDVPHHDDVTDYHLPEGERTKVCSKTLTYLLDGHVGLSADLALIAQAAGLARERNRTFFVDDTHWNRGKWTDHFQDIRARQPDPEPGCRAPPPEELVACPRTARHWVVSSQTSKYHFGHAFSEEFEDPYGRELNRQKPIFMRALESFTTTIRPNAQNAALIHAARKEISAILSNDSSNSRRQAIADVSSDRHPDPYIAVHIRRGDRKAMSWMFRNAYVPLENYVRAAIDTWTRLYPSPPLSESDPAHFPAPPVTYLASDSAHATQEFVASFPPSTAMFGLSMSTNPELRALVPIHEYVQSEFAAESQQERVRLTRGMIVDLAMVSGLWTWDNEVIPSAVVCTITSNVCKLAALGLGFERAFGFDDGKVHPSGDINEKGKRWVEIDNKDQISPVWNAFELF